MIEVIYSIIDLINNFINKLFNFKIDFANGEEVSIGIVVVAFIFFVLVVYLLINAIFGKKDDN